MKSKHKQRLWIFLSIGVLIVCRFVVIVGDVCIFSEAPLLVLKTGLRNMDPISEQCVLKKVSRLKLAINSLV